MPRNIYEMSTDERLSRGIASSGEGILAMLWMLTKFVGVPLAGVTLGWLFVCELLGLTLSPLWVLDQIVFTLTH